MGSGYYIIHNALIYNLMDIIDRRDLSPVTMISYLSGRDASRLDGQNYLDFLPFDPRKHREGLVETFAIESYACLYIGNMIAGLAPDKKVIHTDGKRRTLEEVITRQGKKPEAVFITSMSCNFPTAVATALVLNHGRIPVVVGGIHVSTSPGDVDLFIRKYAPHPDRVAQVIGAGDSSVIRTILNDLAEGRLKDSYRGFVPLEDRLWQPRPNVDPLPPMRMDFLTRLPLVGAPLQKRSRIVPVAPFLGCSYACNFCSVSTLPKKHRKLTMRNTDDFLDELEYRQNSGRFELNFLFFVPDNLILGGSRLEAILDGIVERRLRLHIVAQISIEIASNTKLLKKLRDAGATHFLIGFESLDRRNLEYIGKHILKDARRSGLSIPEYYARQIRTIQDFGISIHGTFIVGLPYDYFRSDRDNTGEEIARFCMDNRIGLQMTPLTDLPGSINFRESQENGSWLYGKQGTMPYLISLCLTDLTEINRIPPDAFDRSPLKLACMNHRAVQKACSTRQALKNAVHMAQKAFRAPTARGRLSSKDRALDTLAAFSSQLIVSLYKEHAEQVSYSPGGGVRGAIERLYDFEKDPEIKAQFRPFAARFFNRPLERSPDEDCRLGGADGT